MKSIYEKCFIHEEEITRVNDHAIKIGSTMLNYKLLPTYCAPSGFADLTGVNLVGLQFKEDLAVILGTPETQFLLADGVINIDKIYKDERFKEYKTERLPVIKFYTGPEEDIEEKLIKSKGKFRVPVSPEVLSNNEVYFKKYGATQQPGDIVIIPSTTEIIGFDIVYRSTWYLEPCPKTLRDGVNPGYPRRFYEIRGPNFAAHCMNIEDATNDSSGLAFDPKTLDPQLAFSAMINVITGTGKTCGFFFKVLIYVFCCLVISSISIATLILKTKLTSNRYQ